MFCFYQTEQYFSSGHVVQLKLEFLKVQRMILYYVPGAYIQVTLRSRNCEG